MQSSTGVGPPATGEGASAYGGSRGPRLIGRDRELEALSDFLDADEQGFDVLAIHGEAGIGKTALWSEGVALAAGRGRRLLTARATESESALAFAGLVDLFAGVSDDEIAAMLPAPQAAALRAALLRAEPAAGAPRHAVGLASLNVLHALARETPVVVAIDDVQWLDRPSSAVVAYVLRRLAGERIRVLATVRAEEPRDAIGLDRLVEEGSAALVEIRGLSLAGVDRLLKSRLDLALTRPALARLVRATSGNPLYALEFGRVLEQRGALDVRAPLPVPPSVREAVAARLARLSDDAADAIVATFALAQPSLALVRRALAASRRSRRAIDEAVASEALELRGESLALAHPLIGSVLYSDLDERRRRALHRRLARLPLAQEERLRHLALATSSPSAALAEELERAADELRGRGAPAGAAELLELAIRLTPPAERDAFFRRSFALALDEYVSGDAERARERWRRLVIEVPPGPLRARALWYLAEFLGATEIAEYERLLGEALREAEGDPALLTEIHSTRAGIALWAGRPMEARAHVSTSVRLAEQRNDPKALAAALGMAATIGFYLGEGIREDVFQRAFALEPAVDEWPIESVPRLYRALIRTWAADDLDRARRELEAVRAVATANGDEVSLPIVLGQLAELECWAGNWDRAAQHAEEASAWVEAVRAWNRRGFALYGAALVDAHRGRTTEARSAAEQALALDEPRGVLVQSGRSRALLGFIELSLGDPAAAVGWLEPLRLRFEEGGYREPSLYRFLPDQLEALVLLGRIDEAAALLAPFAAAARRLERRWALGAADRGAGLIEAARGDMTAAVERLERAVAAHEPLGQPFELARSLLALGAAQRRDRRKAAAAESLGRALEIFDSLGSPLWSDRARRELARLGLRSRAPATLTETERRVAELAAAGHRNEEIAALAFLSVKTVEANLTRIYRKLGVRSRSQLASRLAQIEGFPQ